MVGESLRVIEGPAAGSVLTLGDELLLGRASPGPAALGGDPELSRRHARIHRVDDVLLLEDLASTNGTYLNGWKIPTPQRLVSGDRVQVGVSVMELITPAGAATGVRRAIVAGQAAPERLPQERAVLYATGVKKSYGSHQVLKGVDLEIEPGEICGLLGQNGAGKTTFVSIVAGLRSADEGQVYIAGVDALRDSPGARRHLGIAPQDLGIYPTRTVRQNLSFWGEISGMSGTELDTRVEEVATALSLTPKLDAASGTLSGGQQRRLHTGMAIMHRPRLCILDEPTVGADVRTRQEILDLVRDLAEEGRGIIYSTHYLPEIEALGASVAILDGGAIIARGSIAELIAEHSTPYVELQFDGPAPDIRLEGSKVTREESVLRIETPDPASTAARALGLLGAQTVRLKGIEIIRPSLENVYLGLTERRYTSGDANGGESPDGEGEAEPVARAPVSPVTGPVHAQRSGVRSRP
jgi:ABC-2 type transport system ATP-binding protein